MKRTRPGSRIIFLGLLILLSFGGILLRLWNVQIVRGSEYASKINTNSQVTVRLPAVRGEILDRNGIKLVENRASFEVDFYLPDMVRAYRESKGSVPITTYRGRVHNMPRDLKEADVVKIVSETVIPRMEELGVARDYNANALQIHYRTNREVPYNYRQDLDFEEMAIFSEKNLGLAGVNVSVKPVRWYVYGSMASHLLGYVGSPHELDKLPDLRDFNFYEPDVEGKTQLELFLNEQLKGKAGARILQRNAKGVIEGEVGRREPVQGNNAYLTIDAKIQYIAEQALRVVGRGAAVVVDPRNGDILAMASVPSYDPNVFIPSIPASKWTEINKDETNPLVNRAISAYAPGSTYNGLEDALKVSCNAYFYQFGNAAGIEQIVAMGNMLGLGQKSGIPVSGESPGVLPGPEWLSAINPRARWSNGLTANTAIGQGDVLASPLQMAMVTAAVANGGTVYYPRLVDRIVDQTGKTISQEPPRIRANIVTDGGITQDQINHVRKGMWEVVNEGGGTAGRAANPKMITAGKTGTAQFWRSGKKDNHTWFISFAPYDNPEYVVVVFVQGAKSGGGVSAPIAAKILEGIQKYKSGEEDVQLAALEPAKGNFLFTESVNFDREVAASTKLFDDGETAESPSAAAQENRPNASPNVREEADAAGRVKNKTKPKTADSEAPAPKPEPATPVSTPKPNPIQNIFNFIGGKRENSSGSDQKKKPEKPPAR
ncbi:MAG: penicillin-binding transpeptidase domain-containing protein [Verrucomicrobia bacterium]|nr:penicillin-binding transpeptidase domain-containing protein [Verrucomicrobiota bacterium]